MDRRLLPADQAKALARWRMASAGSRDRLRRSPRALDWRRRVQAELLALLERDRADRFGAVGDLLDEAARLEAPPSAPDEADGEARPGRPPRSAARRP